MIFTKNYKIKKMDRGCLSSNNAGSYFNPLSPFHTFKTLVLSFPQDSRDDTRVEGEEGEKRELPVIIISISRDQTGYLDSEHMICLSTKLSKRDDYSLSPKSRKI